MVALRAEALLTWVYAAGFGGSTIPVAVYLHRRGTLPSFFGLFEMYGGPWWSRFARTTFVWLLVAFLAVTILASLAGWLLWGGSMKGAVMTMVVLPVEALCWFGFDLPIPKLIGVVRVVLLAVGWSSLT
jgi:hypothetical protein